MSVGSEYPAPEMAGARTMTTKRWQQIECGLAFAALAVAVIMLGTPWAWWVSLVIFFAPDLSFVGYAAGPRLGALTYNAVHIYGLGLMVALLGLVSASPGLIAAGGLLAAHVGFDRMLGYGLKEESGFKETHMGAL